MKSVKIDEMKKLLILLLLLLVSLPIFSKSIITNVSINSGKDTINDNKIYGSTALSYSTDKYLAVLASELKEHETTISLLSRWKIGKQTDLRINQYENLRFRESRDMFSILAFSNMYFYYGISSTYSLGAAIAFTFENKGNIRLGTNLFGGAYVKTSRINYIDNLVTSFATFAVINLYLSLYDKVYLQSQISTGSLFYLPSNFAYDFTLMASVAISNSLSLGFSLRTGLADSFAETFFSNRYDYSVFINWEYLL